MAASWYGTIPASEYRNASDESIIVIAQIEDEEGYANVAELAALHELDALFVGRADLAVSLGVDSIDDDAIVFCPLFQDRDGVLDQLSYLNVFNSGFCSPGKTQELMCYFPTAFSLGLDLLQSSSKLMKVATFPEFFLFEQVIDPAGFFNHNSHRIVDFMGHTGRQFTYGCQLSGLERFSSKACFIV